MKKILYLSNVTIPSEASRSLSIMRVCQAFFDMGHRVLLCAVAPSKEKSDPFAYYGLRGGFEVRSDYFSPLFYNDFTCWYLLGGLIQAWRTKPLFRKFMPDIVYSRLTILEMLFVPKDIPIIYEMHSLGALGEKWWRRRALLWVMRHKNIRRIVVTTNVLADWLAKELPGIEVVVARLSAEPPINLSTEQVSEFRRNNLQGDFKLNVGYTGFLDMEGLRGTDIICQTAARMPDIGFHIVGGESEIVEYWKRYAQDWNVHGNIFFYGHRNAGEMPFFLNIFDVVLAPLQFKPNKRAPLGQNMSPLKLPQYLSYGKAIVASDLNAHAEVLKDGTTALLVPHDDVARWVSSIRELVSSPRLRETMGRAAHAAYIGEFTPDHRIRKILEGI